MKIRKILKYLIFTVICILFITILWKQTHLSYHEYDQQSEEYSLENTAEVSVEFPQRVQREVSEGLSFDAEIIVENNFDPNNLYECTAKITAIDEQKWMDYFQINSENCIIEEAKNTARDKSDMTEMIYQCENGNIFCTSKERLFYYADDTGYILRLFDNNTYSPTKNVELYSTESDLPFQSREDNWAAVTELFKINGIDIRDSIIMSEYSMDLNTLIEQEEIFKEAGNIDDDEKNPSWGSEDEGYLYYIFQGYQGLPVFRYEKVREIIDDFENCSLWLYVTEDGIQYMYMRNWFEFESTDQKMTLASFDEVMQTIDEKYGKIAAENKVEVKECRLMLYPMNIGAEYMKVIPVWICRIESIHPGEKTIYLPINAITAEEIYEMEGYD